MPLLKEMRFWGDIYEMKKDALEAQATAGQRAQRWHAACAAVMQRQPAPSPGRLADHLLAAGQPAAAAPCLEQGFTDLEELRQVLVPAPCLEHGDRLFVHPLVHGHVDRDGGALRQEEVDGGHVDRSKSAAVLAALLKRHGYKVAL